MTTVPVRQQFWHCELRAVVVDSRLPASQIARWPRQEQLRLVVATKTALEHRIAGEGRVATKTEAEEIAAWTQIREYLLEDGAGT